MGVTAIQSMNIRLGRWLILLSLPSRTQMGAERVYTHNANKDMSLCKIFVKLNH